MDNVNQPAAGGSKTGMWVALVLAIVVIGVGAYFLFARDNGTNTNNGNSISNQSVNAQANRNINTALNSNSESNTNLVVETNDWLTYQNIEYGFTVKYPKTWTYQVSQQGGKENDQYEIAFDTNRSDVALLPAITVKEDWSIEQEIDAINESDPPYTEVRSVEQLVIDGLPATKVVYDSTIGLAFEEVLIPRNTVVYVFNSLAADVEFSAVATSFSKSK
ncbi:MAG: hypothetical protein HZC01_03460 [Candidatus Kerfeldbacteria bacterium]|nr:hypothetical protein [Candidatus Kerfeldbacteria bacterium]